MTGPEQRLHGQQAESTRLRGPQAGAAGCVVGPVAGQCLGWPAVREIASHKHSGSETVAAAWRPLSCAYLAIRTLDDPNRVDDGRAV